MEIFLRIAGLMYLLIQCVVDTSAQKITAEELGIPRRMIRERDLNERVEIMGDNEFNAFSWGTMLDGQFVYTPMGIDFYKTEDGPRALRLTPPFWVKGIGVSNDSVYIDENRPDTVYIHGCPVKNFVNYHYKSDRKAQLVTLEEVREEFCPETKGRCVYMINKFFIMQYEELYKLDRDFILNVEVVRSSDIASLADQPSFTIIRIFLKTESYWHWENRL